MTKIVRRVLVVGVLFVLGTWLAFSESGPRGPYLRFAKQREAWHRHCDAYIGKPATSRGARDCMDELEELTAHAKRQGWAR